MKMNTYLVVYCPLGQYTLGLGKYANKEVFRCQADNNLHAREQCHNAYPFCKVISVDREEQK